MHTRAHTLHTRSQGGVSAWFDLPSQAEAEEHVTTWAWQLIYNGQPGDYNYGPLGPPGSSTYAQGGIGGEGQ